MVAYPRKGWTEPGLQILWRIFTIAPLDGDGNRGPGCLDGPYGKKWTIG